MSEGKKRIETAAPQANFTITTAERIKALSAGPPAYSLRRREIEDLEASLVKSFRALEAKRDTPLNLAIDVLSTSFDRRFARLQVLITTHNRYYPIEANLPIDTITGAPTEHGEPWRPLPVPSLEALLLASRRLAD